MLAARVVMDQGVHVEGINFFTGFCVEGHTHAIRKKDKAKPKRNNALWVAEQLGIKLHIVDVIEEYKEVLLNPKHGYGQNMNPCLDCKGFMVHKAYEWIQKNYTLDENPGLGQQGLFYYYHTMAKALNVMQVDHLTAENGRWIDWRLELTAKLVELLKEGEHLLVYKGELPTPSRQRMRSLKFAVVIDPALIENADRMGMNVLVAGVLNPSEMTVSKWGWWPIQGIKRKIEVSLLLNAYDIIDGTLFLTHLETRKIKVSTDNPGWEEGNPKIDETELEEELSDIIEDQASKIRDELEDQPWRGKIMSVDGETVVINAGTDMGVTNGSEFQVFSKGERIRSVSGKYFYLLGPKVGEIKTVEAMDSHTKAATVTGGPFKPGQIITIKD